MQFTRMLLAATMMVATSSPFAQGRVVVPFLDPAANAGADPGAGPNRPADPNFHKWFPYRPVDPPPVNAARLIGVLVTDDDIVILTFDQDLTANCFAGNGVSDQPQNGPKRRVWLKAGFEEVTASSLRKMTAIALTALHGGGQLHVMFNYQEIVNGQCWGKYVAITKP